MKPINNFDKAKEEAKYTTTEKLPSGAYEGKILKVSYEDGKNGTSDRIVIAFDLTAGEYSGFFKKQYENNTKEDKKWKGRTSIYIPNDDGSEKDEWTRKAFARWINSIEESNKGYVWDWNEKKLEGKAVGLIFGEVGTIIEGKEIIYTECRFPASIEAVRSGKCKIPMLKAKNGYGTGKPSASNSSNDFLKIDSVGEEEIPFLD